MQVFKIFIIVVFFLSCFNSCHTKRRASNPRVPPGDSALELLRKYDPHISYEDILNAEKNLKSKNSKIHADVMSFLEENQKVLPTFEDISKHKRAYEISIGDKDQTQNTRANTYWNEVYSGSFLKPDISETMIGKFYTVFMRHSIRAEQYYKVDTFKIPQTEIYSIFYPQGTGSFNQEEVTADAELERQKQEKIWKDEPVLSSLGFLLAYAEGLRMKEAGLKFDRIESSPYIRCIQTALMVAIAFDIKEIYINAKLAEKIRFNTKKNEFSFSFGSGGYRDYLNFYFRAPSKNNEIEYSGIKIISDGNPKIYNDLFEAENISEFIDKNRQSNHFLVGHNTFNFNKNSSEILQLSPYGFVRGVLNEDETDFFSLRNFLRSR